MIIKRNCYLKLVITLSKNSNKCYKSFTSTPYSIQDLSGKDVDDKNPILTRLKEEIQSITAAAEWTLRNDIHLLDDIEKYNGFNNASKIGISLGLELPQGVIPSHKESHINYSSGDISYEDHTKNVSKTSGNSRRQWLYHRRVADEATSWLERIKSFNGTSDKYTSSGWKRTAHIGTPCNIRDKISLSIVDKGYAYITNNPFKDGHICLRMVIDGQWYLLYFHFDASRFSEASKVCLPDITVKDNKVLFHFSVEYPYIYKDITSNYFIGVDVNISDYAVVSVIDKNGRVVHSTSLSRRVHSLSNSIKATSRQISSLHKKLDKTSVFDKQYMDIKNEICLQRKKNSNKKKQLAIIAAGEIAYISHIWDNAVVAFEDLSWVKNTMSTGRWNRGELVKRTTEYVELNGGRVISVNPAHTSTQCYFCGSILTFKTWKNAYCTQCKEDVDRDINASCNIGKRAIPTACKMSSTRRKSKSYKRDKSKKDLRTPITKDTLSYKSTGRKKRKTTGKCDNKKKGRQFKKARKKFVEEVGNTYSTTTHYDDVTVLMDGDRYDTLQDPEKAAETNYTRKDMHYVHSLSM